MSPTSAQTVPLTSSLACRRNGSIFSPMAGSRMQNKSATPRRSQKSWNSTKKPKARSPLEKYGSRLTLLVSRKILSHHLNMVANPVTISYSTLARHHSHSRSASPTQRNSHQRPRLRNPLSFDSRLHGRLDGGKRSTRMTKISSRGCRQSVPMLIPLDSTGIWLRMAKGEWSRIVSTSDSKIR
jgi:hypothetical protein